MEVAEDRAQGRELLCQAAVVPFCQKINSVLNDINFCLRQRFATWDLWMPGV
jgi:hypothetical protein